MQGMNIVEELARRIDRDGVFCKVYSICGKRMEEWEQSRAKLALLREARSILLWLLPFSGTRIKDDIQEVDRLMLEEVGFPWGENAELDAQMNQIISRRVSRASAD